MAACHVGVTVTTLRVLPRGWSRAESSLLTAAWSPVARPPSIQEATTVSPLERNMALAARKPQGSQGLRVRKEPEAESRPGDSGQSWLRTPWTFLELWPRARTETKARPSACVPAARSYARGEWPSLASCRRES